jgi:hypothetical protein
LTHAELPRDRRGPRLPAGKQAGKLVCHHAL